MDSIRASGIRILNEATDGDPEVLVALMEVWQARPMPELDDALAHDDAGLLAWELRRVLNLDGSSEGILTLRDALRARKGGGGNGDVS